MSNNSDKIRYGIIGLKGFGQRHLYVAKRNKHIQITALVDIDLECAKTLAAKVGVPAFSDYRKMLDAGLVDAVSIATPNHLHAPISLDCLEAGLHIFVEKPLANRVSEADAMIELAKSKNLKICVGHQYRLYRSYQAIRRLIDDGHIGNILRLLWTWNEFRSDSYYLRHPWRATWSGAGGGVLMNQASHDIDLICWLLGQPIEVSASLGNQLHDAETEDSVCANLVFSNGAIGSLQCTVNQSSVYNIRQIAGENGIIVVQDAKSLTRDRYDRIKLGVYSNTLAALVAKQQHPSDQPKIRWQRVSLPYYFTPTQNLLARKVLRPRRLWRHFGVKTKPEAESHALLMDSFVKAILNGGEALVSAESALPAIEVINGIILSALRKNTVSLPIDREEYDKAFKKLATSASRPSIINH